EEIESSAGGVAQVQLCGQKIISVAKENNIPILIVGHVTKEGTIAGPRVLEHMVDAVLYLEGDRYHNYRLLRGVKNRFGATDEVGVFEMTENGMAEIKNPSEVLLKERLKKTSGSAVTVTIEGTRPILLEIQALTSRTVYGLPKRTALGIDFNRAQLLIAVLSKRLKLSLDKEDIYIGVVGGFKINEPASDLAVALAIISAYKNKPLDCSLACFGEIGLSGEIRSVTHSSKRVYEAEKLGFKTIILPFWGNQNIKSKSKLYLIKTLNEVLKITNLN
ncbi:MAG: magnesium chelatase domain-containing protein, partial [Minisyncoccia bacterium]